MRTHKFYQPLCLVVTFFVTGILTGACGQSRPASASAESSDSGKVVLKVGNVQVTEGDMNILLGSQGARQNAQDNRRTVGERYANMLVLSQAAQSKHMDSSPIFKKQLDLLRNNLLAQMEAQSVAVVTPAEVGQFYSSHQPEFKQAQYYEVAVMKKTPNNEKGLAEDQAQTKAQAIRKALSSGADIKKVAQEFSAPRQVVVITDPQVFQFSPSLPPFEKAAFTMPNGGLSELMNRPDAILFYQVAGHKQQTLQDATPQIEKALQQQKVEETINNLKKQTPVWMDPAYFGSQQDPSLSK